MSSEYVQGVPPYLLVGPLFRGPVEVGVVPVAVVAVATLPAHPEARPDLLLSHLTIGFHCLTQIGSG